jgi:hypothetical protein
MKAEFLAAASSFIVPRSSLKGKDARRLFVRAGAGVAK